MCNLQDGYLDFSVSGKAVEYAAALRASEDVGAKLSVEEGSDAQMHNLSTTYASDVESHVRLGSYGNRTSAFPFSSRTFSTIKSLPSKNLQIEDSRGQPSKAFLDVACIITRAVYLQAPLSSIAINLLFQFH